MAKNNDTPEAEVPADAEAQAEAVVEQPASPEVAPEPAVAEMVADSEPAPAEPEAEAPAAPSGTAYLDHDDPDASASFNGVEIVRDIEGLFLVPLHAVEALVAHGFRLIREPDIMAAGDLTDLATAYVAANIASSSPTTDTVLGTLIAAISAYVPQVVGRNILADNYLELYEGNGKDMLLLRQRPVLQITSIGWNGATPTAQADPMSSASGFFSDGRNACLIGYCFPRGQQVRVAYSAGYVEVPAEVSLAVAELVAEAYSRRTHVGETSRSQGGQVTTSFDPKAMHNAIADKLRNYRHGAPC